ncbi:MAG: hypothetical protein BWY74_00976 [Firmicutes bacterium ADurb.Bin419]|nr:MAG: hypothetical protein BWY74_00976 [Firmicutes bacterium ADurb.Bin419]
MVRAYSLRTPGQKGIHHDSWGSFLGQLLLRTFERAERVYESMILRGFSGEYGIGINKKAGYRDFAFLMGWSAFFVIARIYDIPALLGQVAWSSSAAERPGCETLVSGILFSKLTLHTFCVKYLQE